MSPEEAATRARTAPTRIGRPLLTRAHIGRLPSPSDDTTCHPHLGGPSSSISCYRLTRSSSTAFVERHCPCARAYARLLSRPGARGRGTAAPEGRTELCVEEARQHGGTGGLEWQPRSAV